jgi:hypothetical protein
MQLLLTTGLTAPVLGISIGLTLLAMLIALSVYTGLYYTVPRMLLKWFSRRAIQAV